MRAGWYEGKVTNAKAECKSQLVAHGFHCHSMGMLHNHECFNFHSAWYTMEITLYDARDGKFS